VAKLQQAGNKVQIVDNHENVVAEFSGRGIDQDDTPYFDARDYGAKGDNAVTDDTAAIQAALTAASVQTGSTTFIPAGTYLISAPLIVYSTCKLLLDDEATIKLKSNSNCNMLQSPGVVGGARSNDITVIGGVWDRQDNGGVGNNLHSVVMRNVDRLTIRDMTFKSTAGKYAVCVAGCTEFDIQRMRMNGTFSDGVHLQGACQRGQVRGVYGTAGDDLVALSPKDYAAYVWGDEGDMSDILIEGIHGISTNKTIVKFMGGNGLNLKGITLRHVRGSSSATTGIQIGDDTGSPNTQGGLLDDITLDDIKVSVPANQSHIAINASNGKRFRVNNFHYETGGLANQAGLMLGPDTTTSLESVIVNGLTVADGVANAGAIAVKGVVQHLSVLGASGTPVANATFLRFDDAITTAAIQRVAIVGAQLDWASSTGSVVRCASTSHTLPEIHFSACSFKNVLNILDLATTTTAYFEAGTTTTGSGVASVRVGGTVTISDPSYAAGAKTITNSGTAAFRTAAKATPAYSASITPAANQGPWQTITVTNGTAFTINAPTFPPGANDTATLTIEISNTSGGAMGVVTWNAAFKLVGGAFTNPATGNKRYIRFAWNGSAWVEIARAAADYT
jgi:hypothetical protein